MTEHTSDLLRLLDERGYIHQMTDAKGLDALAGKQIIPGLYAAGRNTAGLPRCAEGYSSGMSIGDATFFGRLAGGSAAARM